MTSRFAVVDLFSGAGGMSLGFHRHPAFRIAAAADAEAGKPSSGMGRLQCNRTYQRNIGIAPAAVDLAAVEPGDLRRVLGLPRNLHVSVLSACPPCTGFSRANPSNHLRDDDRNSHVLRSARFAIALGADILVMENARELIRGNFSHHFDGLRGCMESHGYQVHGGCHLLTRFGLPQIRERALVVAVRRPLHLRTLDDLWSGWRVAPGATTVRRAFEFLSLGFEGGDVSPRFASEAVRRRIAAIPKDGGSWMDLLKRRNGTALLTGSMKRIATEGRIGSYPDVYGRMWLDRPAPTIKRECAHVGNGRYAHPIEDRLCTVREIAALQGFPRDFAFDGSSLSNAYRHIGDAVPPLVSHQIAHLAAWILTGRRPAPPETALRGTHLRGEDIVRA